MSIQGVDLDPGACCPTQLSKKYVSISSPYLRGPNIDMEAEEHGPESHDVKVSGTVN